MFGYSEKPPAIQCGGTPLGRMRDAIHQILSYVATPMAMPILCDVARFMCSVCWGPAAWAGVIVDTRGVRPCGNKAHNLWRRWLVRGVTCNSLQNPNICQKFLSQGLLLACFIHFSKEKITFKAGNSKRMFHGKLYDPFYSPPFPSFRLLVTLHARSVGYYFKAAAKRE